MWQLGRARPRVIGGYRVEIEARLIGERGRPRPTAEAGDRLELTWTGLSPSASPKGIGESGGPPREDWPGWAWLGCEDGSAELRFGPCYAAAALVALESLPVDEAPGFAAAILEADADLAPALITADRFEELGRLDLADWLRALAKARCVRCGGVREDTAVGDFLPSGRGPLDHDWAAIDRVTPAHSFTMLSWCPCDRRTPALGGRSHSGGVVGLRWPIPPRFPFSLQ